MTLTFKLMLKTHTKTGLKYLCMTRRSDWKKYTGSGVHWKRHLAKHGNTFETTLLFETDDYSEFVDIALMYSELYDVVKNPEFANSVPESGYGDDGRPNVMVWWENATDEQRKSVYERRSKTMMLRGNHWSTSDKRDVVSQQISNVQKETWNNLSIEDKKTRVDNFRLALKDFFLNEEWLNAYKKTLSQSARNYWDNISAEKLKERGEKVSIGRLSMSDDKKKARAEKIREKFKVSPARLEYNKRMSTERRGKNNPAVKLCTWFGVEYSKTEFMKLKREEKLTTEYIQSMFETRDDCIPFEEPDRSIRNDVIVCPHCGKMSDPTKSLSGFRKWHLNNCRSRKQSENQIYPT